MSLSPNITQIVLGNMVFDKLSQFEVVFMQIARCVHYLVYDYVPISHKGDVIIALGVLWIKY